MTSAPLTRWDEIPRGDLPPNPLPLSNHEKTPYKPQMRDKVQTTRPMVHFKSVTVVQKKDSLMLWSQCLSPQNS